MKIPVSSGKLIMWEKFIIHLVQSQQTKVCSNLTIMLLEPDLANLFEVNIKGREKMTVNLCKFSHISHMCENLPRLTVIVSLPFILTSNKFARSRSSSTIVKFEHIFVCCD